MRGPLSGRVVLHSRTAAQPHGPRPHGCTSRSDTVHRPVGVPGGDPGDPPLPGR
jgi:hypothetical protein